MSAAEYRPFRLVGPIVSDYAGSTPSATREALMENLLPPLLILLAVAAVVVILIRLGSRRNRASLDTAMAGGPEAAAAASARLTEDQHQAIYSLIARGLAVQAIAVYRQATATSLVEARNAVLLLERYPQPFRGRAAAEAPQNAEQAPDAAATTSEPAATPEPPAAPAVDREPPAPLAPEPPADVVPSAEATGRDPEAEARPASARPAANEPRPQRFPYRYRAIVSDGRQTLEVASNMLNDEIYGEIKALAQIGDAEDAAQMLRRHSDISIDEARAFVALL
jgi:ribosomal protein L7/L12